MDRTTFLRERDDLLDNVLQNISNSTLLKDLVLQGGGALHFVYGSPRMSLDLDFVVGEKNEFDVGKIVKGLRSLREYMGENGPSINISEDGNLVRAKYQPIKEPNTPIAKVEVFRLNSFEPRKTEGKYSPLIVESPAEIYADKIVATLDRVRQGRGLKPTDLFDLEFILRNFDIDVRTDLLKAKADSYDYEGLITEDNMQRTAEFVKNPYNQGIFQKHIRRSLLPDYAANLSLEQAYFDNAAEHFEHFADNL